MIRGERVEHEAFQFVPSQPGREPRFVAKRQLHEARISHRVRDFTLGRVEKLGNWGAVIAKFSCKPSNASIAARAG